MIAQVSIVRRPICPTFIHDDTSRILISIIGIIICLIIFVKLFRSISKE
jgi:hypothetical protein